MCQAGRVALRADDGVYERNGRYGSSVPKLSVRAGNNEAARTSGTRTLRSSKLILLRLVSSHRANKLAVSCGTNGADLATKRTALR